jgi:hypothetical protein
MACFTQYWTPLWLTLIHVVHDHAAVEAAIAGGSPATLPNT